MTITIFDDRTTIVGRTIFPLNWHSYYLQPDLTISRSIITNLWCRERYLFVLYLTSPFWQYGRLLLSFKIQDDKMTNKVTNKLLLQRTPVQTWSALLLLLRFHFHERRKRCKHLTHKQQVQWGLNLPHPFTLPVSQFCSARQFFRIAHRSSLIPFQPPLPFLLSVSSMRHSKWALKNKTLFTDASWNANLKHQPLSILGKKIPAV